MNRLPGCCGKSFSVPSFILGTALLIRFKFDGAALIPHFLHTAEQRSPFLSVLAKSSGVKSKDKSIAVSLRLAKKIAFPRVAPYLCNQAFGRPLNDASMTLICARGLCKASFNARLAPSLCPRRCNDIFALF